MPDETWTTSSITIAKREVPVRLGKLPQTRIVFYADNPRVHSVIHSGVGEPSQEFIEERLASSEHVKQLVQSIRANGGLTDPVLVRDGDYVVLEGNSRLAAYRQLARNDALKWGEIKVALLPADIDESTVFALLGEYHIIGRKDWAPYEQAGYLWRRVSRHDISTASVAREMGLPPGYVRHLVDVYRFMLKHCDNDITRWSYYDELLKVAAVRQAFRVDPKTEERTVAKIKSGEVARAIDVRDKVARIFKSGGEALTLFVSKSNSLDAAYRLAVEPHSTWLPRLGRWREQLAGRDLAVEIKRASAPERERFRYELRVIARLVAKLLEKLPDGAKVG